MCHVPSWIEANGKIFFLTDKDVIAWHDENKQGQAIRWLDFTGHSGIRTIYPGIGGEKKEEFPCPKKIEKAMLSKKMLNIMLNTEGSIDSWPNDKNWQQIYKIMAIKASDWSVREAAVARVEDQALLCDISKTDSDWRVRAAAVARVEDQALLCDISKTDSDCDVRAAAVARVEDLKKQ